MIKILHYYDYDQSACLYALLFYFFRTHFDTLLVLFSGLRWPHFNLAR